MNESGDVLAVRRSGATHRLKSLISRRRDGVDMAGRPVAQESAFVRSWAEARTAGTAGHGLRRDGTDGEPDDCAAPLLLLLASSHLRTAAKTRSGARDRFLSASPPPPRPPFFSSVLLRFFPSPAFDSVRKLLSARKSQI